MMFVLDVRRSDMLLGSRFMEVTMRSAALSILVVGVIGCRAGGSGPGPGSGDVDAPPAGGSQSIKSIRMTQPTNGAPITLQNVVVTGHVSSKKYGHVWVQDQGGGAYSGIQLFCNYGGTKPSCMMTQSQIDALTVGSVVNVTGTFSSFLLGTAPAGAQPNLEIDAPMITATGQTMAAVPVDVPAAMIARDQLASTAADPYKGAYVHVTGSFPISSTTPKEFSSTCTDKSTPPQSGTTFGGVEVTGGGQTLAIGLNFYNTMTFCLPCAGVAMPYPCTNALSNQTFTSVSGVVEPEYNKNGMVYLQISPTTDADLPH